MIQRYVQFYFLKKGLELAYPYFVYKYFKKNISQVTFYKLTKFYCLITFSFWDIGQYAYCNYHFPFCDVINLEVNFLLYYQVVFLLCSKKLGQKFKYLENENMLLRWNKKHFSVFLKGFHWSRWNQFSWKVRVRL